MANIDEEIRLDEEENRRELAYIRTQLPTDIKKYYSDKDILYMMDLIVDYYYTSGILESRKSTSTWRPSPNTSVRKPRKKDSVPPIIQRKCSSSFRQTWISRNRTFRRGWLSSRPLFL